MPEVVDAHSLLESVGRATRRAERTDSVAGSVGGDAGVAHNRSQPRSRSDKRCRTSANRLKVCQVEHDGLGGAARRARK